MGRKNKLRREIITSIEHSPFADAILALTLKNAIDSCVMDIEHLERNIELKEYEVEDLKDSYNALDYLTKTYHYFTGDYEMKPKYYVVK